MTDREVFQLAEVLWSYHWLNQDLVPAECMIVLGSDDLRVAEYAAELFHRGLSKLIVVTGQANRYSSHFLPLSEAEMFAQVLKEKGVPAELTLLENLATNTGDNILFSRQLLQDHNLQPKNFLVVTKPYMERRVYATFHKLWPDQDFAVTSPTLNLSEYIDQQHPLDRLIRAMIGYVHRMETYPALGFQISQPIPAEVKAAAEKLEALGYQAV